MAIVEFKDVSRVYTSGDHELKALDHVNMKLADYRAATVGFVFRFYNLIPTLTVHGVEKE